MTMRINSERNVQDQGQEFVHSASPQATADNTLTNHAALSSFRAVRSGDGHVRAPRVSSAPASQGIRPKLGSTLNNSPAQGSFAAVDARRWSVDVFPTGAHYDGEDATFSVYSGNAEMVILEVYDDAFGVEAKYRYPMERKGDHWQAKLADVPEGTNYAFRFFGPNWRYTQDWEPGSDKGFRADVDEFGNRFNPNKVIADPYGRELSHDKDSRALRAAGHDPGVYGSGNDVYQGRARRLADTGPYAPKSVLFRDNTDFGTKPQLPEENSIIYEAHVKGLTEHPSSMKLQDIVLGLSGFEDVKNVPNELRGTYKGAAYMASYLKAIGVNTIELLPVHEASNDTNPTDNTAGGNFWGYMTENFFSPDRRYSSDKSAGGPTREFKQMVKSFHDAGIEVYLDVVYNHTGEGGLWGGDENTAELTSLRGVDNAGYYALANNNRSYWESTGVGNNLDGSRPAGQQLILDSLTYWAKDMGVDGFRFDLASVLGRVKDQDYAFDRSAPLLKDINKLAKTLNVKIVAEAWDAQASGYQVGQFPGGWAEWNGKYRDSMRKFIRSSGNMQEFMEAFAGTASLFRGHGGPQKSVNFINAHDGLTMTDLVGYNDKVNDQPAPFGPSDGGASDNNAWDTRVGSEKDTQALRRRQLKNLWVLHMFARGVPMVVYGDEYGRTQNGNNNAYNLDTVATQNNYDMIDTNAPHERETGGGGAYNNVLGTSAGSESKNTLFAFNTFVTRLRQQHPALNQASYDKVNIEYLSPEGGPWRSGDRHAVAIAIDGTAVKDNDFLLLVNTYWEPVQFQVPPAQPGKKWVRVVDTANWSEAEDSFWPSDEATAIFGSYYNHERSVVVLQEVDI